MSPDLDGDTALLIVAALCGLFAAVGYTALRQGSTCWIALGFAAWAMCSVLFFGAFNLILGPK